MKSEMPGTDTSAVEITNISQHGFWILLEGHELFLAFHDFPWFKDAAVGAIVKVEYHHPQHLYWPDLDIDLHVESIEDPAQFPLISQAKKTGFPPSRELRDVRTAGSNYCPMIGFPSSPSNRESSIFVPDRRLRNDGNS